MKHYTVLKYKIIPKLNQLQKLKLMFDEADSIWKLIIDQSLTDPRLAKNFKAKHLGSQFKQDLSREFQNLLSSQKELKKLNKSGLIKYKRKRVLSAFSNQPVQLISDTQIRIQKLGKFYVRGIKSNTKYINKLLDKGIISSYKVVAYQLLQKANGYYLHQIIQLNDYDLSKYKEFDKIGIDLGIKDNIVLSDGTSLNWEVIESSKLKSLQRKLSNLDKNKESDRKRFMKLAFLIRKEHERIDFKKDHIIATLMNFFKKFDQVAIQNEMIKIWKESYFGKQIHHRFYGRIYEKLKQQLNVVVIDKSIPTTKTCCKCGSIQDISLEQREYICDCGNTINRDLNSAINIYQTAFNELINPDQINKLNFELDSKYIKIS